MQANTSLRFKISRAAGNNVLKALQKRADSAAADA